MMAYGEECKILRSRIACTVCSFVWVWLKTEMEFLFAGAFAAVCIFASTWVGGCDVMVSGLVIDEFDFFEREGEVLSAVLHGEVVVAFIEKD